MRRFVFSALLLALLCLKVQASIRVVIPEDLPVVYDINMKTGDAKASCSYSSATTEQLNREEVYIRDEVEVDGVSYPVTSLSNDFYNLFAAEWEPKRPVSPQSVRLPAHLKAIGDYAFRSCTELREIFISSEVRSLGNSAFLWASGLKWIFNASKQLDLGDRYGLGGAQNAIVCNVDTLGQTNDFRYYTLNGLRYIFDLQETSHLVIPEGYQPGLQLCYNWKSLQRVSLPSDIQSIEKETFYGCTDLEQIDGLDRVTSIGDFAFYSCENLQEANLGPRLRQLGNHAFSYCRSLKSIVLSDSLTSLGMATFLGCESLTSVRLPQHLSVLPEALFLSCSSLTGIELPESIRIIKSQCFDDCRNLIDIQLPDGLKEIQFEAFADCKSLKEIRIPEQVKVLEYMSFIGCESLERVHLGANLEKIWGYCFADCTNLHYLICDAATPPLANNSCFKNLPFYKCEVYVQPTSVEAYKTADGWQNFRLFNEAWDLAIDNVLHDEALDVPAVDILGRNLNSTDSHKGLMIQNNSVILKR